MNKLYRHNCCPQRLLTSRRCLRAMGLQWNWPLFHNNEEEEEEEEEKEEEEEEAIVVWTCGFFGMVFEPPR